MPNTVQLAEHYRDTSSSISSAPQRPLRSRAFSTSFRGALSPEARRSAVSGASLVMPGSREVSDAGLDLIKDDIAEPARGDDLLTIYHDVGNGARRQQIHHVLF